GDAADRRIARLLAVTGIDVPARDREVVADPVGKIADVDGAGIGVVAGGVRAAAAGDRLMRAPTGGVAPVRGARIGVVAGERTARRAPAVRGVAGLRSVAHVVIVARGVARAAARARRVDAAGARRAGVRGAGDAVVAVERR